MKHLPRLARIARKTGLHASAIDATSATEHAVELGQLAALYAKRDALAHREPGLVATLCGSSRRLPVMRSLTRLVLA
jgi:hypothetical protein